MSYVIHVNALLAHVHVCVTYIPSVYGGQQRAAGPLNQSYPWLWATTGVLRTELHSFGEIPNAETTFLSPSLSFFPGTMYFRNVRTFSFSLLTESGSKDMVITEGLDDIRENRQCRRERSNDEEHRGGLLLRRKALLH